MEFVEFKDRDAASAAAAEFLEDRLRRRLDLQRRASMIITGGSSPGKCYEALAHADLDWSRVNFVLSDERWIPADHDDSNEKQARETLLVNGASKALLTPMYQDAIQIEARCEVLNEQLRLLPVPFSAALLGMGEDGHFASLFPDASNLEEGLDTNNKDFCLPVNTEASPYVRLSLTLSAIARSDAIVLLVFGEGKRDVLEKALNGDKSYPITSLLRQKQAPVYAYWAP